MINDTLHRGSESGPTRAYQGLPIGPAEVRAGIAREVGALADLGLSASEALARAIAVTASRIRNAPVLAERQAHDGRCYACSKPLDGTRPEVAILQAKGGGPLWMHGGECHEMHSRRRAALVDEIMVAAGYGPGDRTEAA